MSSFLVLIIAYLTVVVRMTTLMTSGKFKNKIRLTKTLKKKIVISD